MDVTKMLAELKAELQGVNEAIMIMERLALGGKRRRGRPPAWLRAVQGGGEPAAAAAPKKRGRPKGSKNKAEAAD